MSKNHFTGAFAPSQRRALHEVVALINAYTEGHASLDAALTLSAIKARAGGLDVTDFVATVKAVAPQVSVPAALLAWLSAPSPSMLPPAPPIAGFASDDDREDFYVRR